MAMRMMYERFWLGNQVLSESLLLIENLLKVTYQICKTHLRDVIFDGLTLSCINRLTVLQQSCSSKSI